MQVTITKSCSIRLNGIVQALQAEARINLPDDKARRLIDAGYAESINTVEEAQTMIADFGKCDPGGNCWEWIKEHMPDLWRSHVKALLADDISTARLTFNKMIEAWKHRGNNTQPGLLAA